MTLDLEAVQRGDQRPPGGIGWPVDKIARKDHACCECRGRIPSGTHYIQDDHYAPFGNGKRYCLGCARRVQDAFDDYHARLRAALSGKPEGEGKDV